MSSELIYRMEVVRLPAADTGDYDDNFLWLVEAGSSNCWEIDNKRRSRDWECMAIGQHYEVVRRVCEVAGSCEGGGINYPGGRHCKPERLIRAYRNAEERALHGFAEASRAGFILTPRIRFPAKREEIDQYHYDALLKAGKTPEKETAYGAVREVFAFDRNVKADLKLWLDHCRGAGWNNVETIGPRGEVYRPAKVTA